MSPANGNGALRTVLTIVAIAVPLIVGGFAVTRHELERHEDSLGAHPQLARDIHTLEIRTQRIEDKVDLLLKARGITP